MIATGIDLYKKYGKPEDKKNIVFWDVPAEIEIGMLPNRMMINKDMIGPISKVFKILIETGLVNEIKTWDGCYNVRPIRGYEKKYQDLIDKGLFEEAMKYMSIHSWGTAIDVNAFENGLGKVPKLSPEFAKVWTDNGFDWGANFPRQDGMHFQMKLWM